MKSPLSLSHLDGARSNRPAAPNVSQNGGRWNLPYEGKSSRSVVMPEAIPLSARRASRDSVTASDDDSDEESEYDLAMCWRIARKMG